MVSNYQYINDYKKAVFIIGECISFYKNCRIQNKTKLTLLEKQNQFVF